MDTRASMRLMPRRLPALLTVAVTLSGCVVGPDYRRPEVTPPKDFRSQVAPAEAGSLADLPWWQVFNDKALQGLITQALAGNYDLKVAVTRIEQARQVTGANRVLSDSTFTSRNGGMPVSGKGDFSVMIIDSGIDATHGDLPLGPKVVQNVQVLTSSDLVSDSVFVPLVVVEDVPNTDQSVGHGTHCAGIVGGTGLRSGGRYAGVAPGSKLIGAVTPLAFCSSVNFGITQFWIQFAPRAFFPPAAALATIVRVISLASAFCF